MKNENHKISTCLPFTHAILVCAHACVSVSTCLSMPPVGLDIIQSVDLFLLLRERQIEAGNVCVCVRVCVCVCVCMP